MKSLNTIQRYSATLIIIGGCLLIATLLMARGTYSTRTAVPFIDPPFLALFATAVIVASGMAGLAMGGHIARWARYRAVAFAWILFSFGAIFTAEARISALRPYIAPLFLWLLLCNIAIAFSALEPLLARISWGRVARALGFAVASFVIPLLVMELALRFWFSAFGSNSERIAYLYSAQEIADALSPLEGAPYVNYELTANYEGHNDRGYRSPEIARPKPDGIFRIFALGGSTTYGIDIPAQDAYPAQLQRILRDQYGYTHVEVINAGVIAYNSYDLFAHFAYRVLDDEPDMIIIYEAINDVTARLVDPRYYNSLNPSRGIWSLRDRELPNSVLLRFIGINSGLMLNPNTLSWALNNVSPIYRCDDVEFCAPLGMTPQEVLDANPPIYFERNLRHIIQLAQANDVAVVLSSWAYFPEVSNGNPYMTYAFVQNGVAQHNAITRQLADDFGLPYIPLADAMPYNADFWLDGMHMTRAGAEQQAAIYADFLVANQLIPPAP